MQRLWSENPDWEVGSFSSIVLWPIAAYAVWAVVYYVLVLPHLSRCSCAELSGVSSAAQHTSARR